MWLCLHLNQTKTGPCRQANSPVQNFNDMPNVNVPEGSFSVSGNKISLPSGSLLIASRSPGKFNRAKGELYLLYIQPDGQRKYVSSLWLESPDVYQFEYGRRRFRLSLSDNLASVAGMVGVTNSHVSHKELVQKVGTLGEGRG